ncbi:MAG TPA: hypothetical protein VEA99_01355, partial [Gemmatimonadaceae bacterium]|nr:hypothetical protein [Gemmatimonadaceae bacterium]
MRVPATIRWILLPIASMGACSGVVIAADQVAGTLTRRITPEQGRAIEAALPADVRAGLVYALAAMVFVIVGWLLAPKYRAVVAVMLYIVGASLAWWGLRGWYFPEGHPRRYEPSGVPLALCLLGGLAALLLVVARPLRVALGAVRS